MHPRHGLVPASLRVLALGVLPSLAACASDSASGPSVAVRVAPLSLPGIAGACYDLAVTAGASTVWSQGDPAWTRAGGAQATHAQAVTGAPDTGAICSGQYGNGPGGDITYIGTCDATADADGNPGNGIQNRVTLWVDGLYDGAGVDIGQWQDPCPSGCYLDVDCEENTDHQAVFDLTIMRDANQGFFDVAVNFEDIFCSAKLDTCYANATETLADDAHIELLFGGDQVRDWTAVYGFACTAGPGAAVETNLLYGAVSLTCGATTFPIDPTVASGNASITVDGKTLHYGIYRGDEQLSCDGAPCNKRYWNLAVSLSDLEALFPGETCSLALAATANDGGDGFVSGLPTATGLAYPYVEVQADLTTEGAARCQENGLDRGGAVATGYHGGLGGLTAPPTMCWQFAGGAAAAVAGAGCGGGAGPLTDALPAPASASRFQWQGVQRDFTPSTCTGEIVAGMGSDSLCYVDAGNRLLCSGALVGVPAASGFVDTGLVDVVQVLVFFADNALVAVLRDGRVMYRGGANNLWTESSDAFVAINPPGVVARAVATGTWDALCILSTADEVWCEGSVIAGTGTWRREATGVTTLWMDAGSGSHYDDPNVYRAMSGRTEGWVGADGANIEGGIYGAAGAIADIGAPGFSTPYWLESDGKVYAWECETGNFDDCDEGDAAFATMPHFGSLPSLALVGNGYSAGICTVLQDGSLWCNGDGFVTYGVGTPLLGDTMVLGPGSVKLPTCTTP